MYNDIIVVPNWHRLKENTMKPLESGIKYIRRRVFYEVAKLAFKGDYSQLEEIPYRIIKGDKARYRSSVFLERAIVGERLRLAIGLPLRTMEEHAPLSMGITESAIAEKYYDPPLINIIRFACNACPDKYVITECCQSCLERACMQVCPKDAISIEKGRVVIEESRCIKCGRCKEACPYGAVIHLERPCAQACGVDAISSDESGRAVIDYDRCVYCGMCIVECPFGAISDKGQMFQLIHALKRKEEVIAIVAPSFLGQFGPSVTPEELIAGMKLLGFSKIAEVAVGADLCAIEEAKEFLRDVPEKQPFMATSCCPSWRIMAKRQFPELTSNISLTLTPMVITARLQKKEHPDSRIVFVGPCSAKKIEANRKTVRSDVDFVITYEELMAMFNAKGINLDNIDGGETFSEGTATGKGFPVSGGVASAVDDVIKQLDPDYELKVAKAEGLRDCKRLLADAAMGAYDGYLLEGMACPGGCVSGTGTLCASRKAEALVNVYKSNSDEKNALESEHVISAELFEE